MNFQGPGVKLKDEDLPKIGSRIGVGEDEIHAVLDVETRGGGFDKYNRPKMLFEPHIFHRLLRNTGNDTLLRTAEAHGLAYRKWGEKKYPKDSYPVLEKAMHLDKELALKSASWGLGQIMGFNHALVGYGSAEMMVAQFVDAGEPAQLEAMVAFIISAELDDEIREHDWAGFARGYNGSGYKKHGYHKKLEQRFAFWKGKPDTPWSMDRVG